MGFPESHFHDISCIITLEERDWIPLRAAEEQLRALPARHTKPRRAARRVGRWIAAGAVLAVIVGAGAVGAVTRSDSGPIAKPALTPSGPATTTTTPPFRYADGVIETDLGRWTIGLAGDVVVVGDWDCDGMETPSLLRPATGTVYAFNEWAPGGRDVVAELLGTLAGASRLTADDVDGDGCDDVVVENDEGEEVVFHPADRL